MREGQPGSPGPARDPAPGRSRSRRGGWPGPRASRTREVRRYGTVRVRGAVRRCGRIGRAETKRCKAEPQRRAPGDQEGGVSASASAGMLVYSGGVWQARTPLVRTAAPVSVAPLALPRSKVPRTGATDWCHGLTAAPAPKRTKTRCNATSCVPADSLACAHRGSAFLAIRGWLPSKLLRPRQAVRRPYFYTAPLPLCPSATLCASKVWRQPTRDAIRT
jgi:hypothetical protein